MTSGFICQGLIAPDGYPVIFYHCTDRLADQQRRVAFEAGGETVEALKYSQQGEFDYSEVAREMPIVYDLIAGALTPTERERYDLHSYDRAPGLR